MTKYYEIKNYVCKCRLYPNKTQAEQIDNLIDAARLFHNAALYDVLVNRNPDVVYAAPDKFNPNGIVHWIDFNAMAAAPYLNKLREIDPRINRINGTALSGKHTGVVADMKKAWKRTGEVPIEKFGEKYRNENGEEITKGITYYTKKKCRKSYTCYPQQNIITFTKNPKVIKVKLRSKHYSVDGEVKIRGFNNDLRFDSSCMMEFHDYIEANPKKKLRITVSKNNCGEYYISFLLPKVYKPINESETLAEEVGIDVGEVDLMTTYDGSKVEKTGNLRDHNRKIVREQKAREVLGRQLSRRQGWSNEDFRERHKKDKTLEPSKSYAYTQERYNKAANKIVNQRKDFQHKMVMDVIKEAQNISIEGLRVKDLFDSKSKGKKNGKNKKAKKKAQS